MFASWLSVILLCEIQPTVISSLTDSGTEIILFPFKSEFRIPVEIVYLFNPINKLKRVALSLTLMFLL